MEALVVLALVILGLAGVGAISLLRMMFGSGPPHERVIVQETSAPLGRAEKLAIVWDVMGMRMPEDLRQEMARLRGWRPAAPEVAAAPAVATMAAAPELAVVPELAPPPDLAPAAELAPAPAVAAVPFLPATYDDEALPVAPEVAAAAPHAPHWLRSFLSFENTIFLLAACLVLGGTMYVVATTWGHVPGSWRYLFLEGVVLFYGTALLGAATLLDRRLGLASAARFLATTAAITTVGAAVAACAAYRQSAVAGAIGTVLAAVVGALDARAVLRLAGPRARAAPVFGVAVALLAGVGGLVAAGHAEGGALLLFAAVVTGGALWLLPSDTPSVPLLATSAALPAAAVLLVVGRWLPASLVGPAIVAAGGSLAAIGAALVGPPVALVLVGLQVAGLGVSEGGARLSVTTLVIGLAVGLARLARVGRVEARTPASAERTLVGALVAGQWIALAFWWPRAADILGPHLGAQAWAWNGVAALPFALVTLARSRPDGRGLPAAVLAAGPLIVLGTLVMALAPYPALGVGSLVAGAGAAALLYAWARRGHAWLGASPWVAAHAVGLLAVWLGGRIAAPHLATAAVATAALPLLLLPRGRVHRLCGTLALPVALFLALADGAPGAWLAALAAAYGALHLTRPVPLGDEGAPSTRALGPLALVGAVGLALLAPNGAHAALVSFEAWPIVLAAAVTPLVAWVAWRGGPAFAAAEAFAGLAVAALAGQAMAALALACALLVGRAPGAVVAAVVALWPLAALAVGQHARPELVAAALLVGGAAVWRRPLPASGGAWMRWLAMPTLVAAVLALCFVSAPGGVAWVPAHAWPLVAASALLPFALAVARGIAPTFVRDELIVMGGLAGGAAIIAAYTRAPASAAALQAGGAALLALACGLVGAHRREGLARRAGWIAALLIAPAAVVPTGASPLALRSALSGLLAVAALGAVSKGLRARDVGAWALAAALPAVWWALAAVAKHYSTGAPPEHLLPALAVVSALYGVGAVLDARRLAEVSERVPRILGRVALAFAGAFTVAAAAFIDGPDLRDAALTLAALGCLGALALVIAFSERVGWPFLVAESVLGLGYSYLRARTPWLDGLGDWDGVAACVGGFACFATERWLRRAHDGLGAEESRLMATLLPMLSSFFLRPDAPLTGLGPALGAAFLAFLAIPARVGARPLHGWLAGVLANLSLLALWPELDVRSPVAYALPAGLTLAILCRLYRESLGAAASPLRTLSSLLCFVATSWEMFRFQSLWPAAMLAATAVGAVLLGIHVRARAYLTLGFAALLLDIITNLTRWGMRDRLLGGALGVGSGVVLFALGIVVSRHKELALARYRTVQAWPW